MRKGLVVVAGALLAVFISGSHAPLDAQRGEASTGCAQPMADPVAYVPLPGEALFVQATRDGCWLFVRTSGGLSVLRRHDGTITPVRESVAVGGVGPIALTHDERILVARSPAQLVFFDVKKLTAVDSDPRLGVIESPRFDRPVNSPATLLVTPDDTYLVATHFWTAWISVIDLDHIRRDGPSADAIVAGTAAADFPNGVRASPDGRLLYVSQAGATGIEEPVSSCESVYTTGQPTGSVWEPSRPAVVSVLDMRALLAGSEPFVADVVTACSSISMAVSANGDRLYVAAHGRHELLVFDTNPIGRGVPPRLVGAVPLAVGLRDVVLVDEGRTIVVGHGDFGAFIPNGPPMLTVIDASSVALGAAAVRGVIPTRSGIAGLTVSADGRTLFAPNRAARTLQVIDLDRVSLEPPPASSAARRQ